MRVHVVEGKDLLITLFRPGLLVGNQTLVTLCGERNKHEFHIYAATEQPFGAEAAIQVGPRVARAQ